MFVLITFILLFLCVLALVTLSLTRPAASYPWLVAMLGALLAWGSVFFWQNDLPRYIAPGVWMPLTLFTSSPLLLVDSFSWLYALSLTALAAGVILTTPARGLQVSPLAWVGTLVVTMLGLVSVLAGNLLMLVLAWTALDLTEFLNTVRVVRTPELSERAVVSFSVRAAGTGFALWASVLSHVNGQTLSFSDLPAQAGVFVLLAAGLRLGVLPLHLTFRREPALRRGFGTILRLTVAASSLVALARIPVSAIEARWVPVLLGLTVLAALYGGWKWFSTRDELSARPFWLIGMGALSLSAALRGNSAGSAAWGTALLLFGGISFLYSTRQIWVTRLLAGLGLALLGLPFTLTAAGWQGDLPLAFYLWPLFLVAHALLVAGYLRHLFRSGETQWAGLFRWVQAVYLLGLGALVSVSLLGGLWGWPGARILGEWRAGLVVSLLTSLIALALLRLPGLMPEAAESSGTSSSRYVIFQETLVRLLWELYRLIGRFFAYISILLEGDGGLLWTLLLLVLLASYLGGR
jgi:hypothetical protein